MLTHVFSAIAVFLGKKEESNSAKYKEQILMIIKTGSILSSGANRLNYCSSCLS